MVSTDYILKSLERISDIPGIRIRYEYRVPLKTHFIEILPQVIFDTEIGYLAFEIAMEQEFEALFSHTNEELLFISEDSLCSIKNPQATFGYESV